MRILREARGRLNRTSRHCKTQGGCKAASGTCTDEGYRALRQESEILAKARQEASEIIEEAKAEADAAIRKYNKWTTNPAKADAKAMEPRDRSSARRSTTSAR